MYKLSIELKRVQSFIFDVPRLKSMLGANALLGDTMRHELSAILPDSRGVLEWPAEVRCDRANDPLNAASSPEDQDDPSALYDKGILARDGGHFIAVFAEKEQANAFKREAEALLARRLPGVLFDIEIAPLVEGDETSPSPGAARHPVPTSGETAGVRSDGAQDDRGGTDEVVGVDLAHLPIFQICMDTGREAASEPITYRDETRWVGRSVKMRWDFGDEFKGGNTKDIIGLLRNALYPNSAKNWKEPEDLEDLVKRGAKDSPGRGYLALIHSDGNRIGQRFSEWRDKGNSRGGDAKKSKKETILREARGEAFFHSMRVAVRRSVVAALDKIFEAAEEESFRPYQVLMLGGDDLLLACRAEKALDFALNYARELQIHELTDGKRLDVAIGVAIAQYTYPLHRLQELAESLSSSAKRLYRALPEQDRQSVIDWQVVTQSWFEDVAEARSRSELIRYSIDEKSETLLLSQRPYKALCGASLEYLLNSARALDADAAQEEKTARSALRSLRSACEQGRLSGEMAFARLPHHVREALGFARQLKDGTVVRDLWEEIKASGGKTYATRAMDIIDIYEIGRLGRTAQ